MSVEDQITELLDLVERQDGRIQALEEALNVVAENFGIAFRRIKAIDDELAQRRGNEALLGVLAEQTLRRQRQAQASTPAPLPPSDRPRRTIEEAVAIRDRYLAERRAKEEQAELLRSDRRGEEPDAGAVPAPTGEQ
jgi:hypothetical protein